MTDTDRITHAKFIGSIEEWKITTTDTLKELQQDIDGQQGLKTRLTVLETRLEEKSLEHQVGLQSANKAGNLKLGGIGGTVAILEILRQLGIV